MADHTAQPSDHGVIRSGKHDASHDENARPWVLAATILGSSLASITASAINVALPNLQSALNTTLVNAQWVVNAYTLFLAALILLGGSLGDHYGRKRIYIIGTLIFGAASVWSGLALQRDAAYRRSRRAGRRRGPLNAGLARHYQRELSERRAR